MAAGADHVAVFAAASESFSRKNINCSIAESIERFLPVMAAAREHKVKVRGYVSCVIGCPYEGDIAPQQVAQVSQRLIDIGCFEVSLGDTIGVGTPASVQRMLEAVAAVVPLAQLAGHYHDTYGMAVANVFASYQFGLRCFDASVAGLGGCPYAKGATGNVATEDVVYLLHGLGAQTGIDLQRLVRHGGMDQRRARTRAGLARRPCADRQACEGGSDLITLYHCVSARSFRVLWMLEELGAPYELKMLPFPPRVQQRSFLEINPLGTVPLMLDGATRMTESAAICQYLAQRFAPTPLNVEPGEADFGAYLNYLHFGEATLTFPQTLVLRYARFEPEARRIPQVAEDYSKWFLARLRGLEPHLASPRRTCAPTASPPPTCRWASRCCRHSIWACTRDSRLPSRPIGSGFVLREAYARAMKAQDAAARAQGVSPVPAPDTTP